VIFIHKIKEDKCLLCPLAVLNLLEDQYKVSSMPNNPQ
jgi:hypothetical protein